MSKQDKKLFQQYVGGKLFYLKNIGELESGQQKAALAELRRGIGHKPGELPRLWGMLLENMPENLVGKYIEPSYAEWAVYITLTLFALHQQGHDPSKEWMHKNKAVLGKAIAKLVKKEDDKERIIRRFNMIVTSNDIEELSHHLRGVIQLLRAEGIPLDYVQLADDLFWYQNENQRASVALRWGREFYRALNNKSKESTEKESNGNE